MTEAETAALSSWYQAVNTEALRFAAEQDAMREKAGRRDRARRPPTTKVVLDLRNGEWVPIEQAAAEWGIEILDHDTVDALSEVERSAYLMRLFDFCADWGIDDSANSPWAAWRKHASRCTAVVEDPETGVPRRCSVERWTGGRYCIGHTTALEVAPARTARDRAAQAKLRMAEQLDTAVDRLTALLEGEDVSPGVRLKAIETLFDRTGVVRETSTTVNAHAEVTVHDGASAAEVIASRLERLADSLVSDELQGIAEVSGLPAGSGAGPDSDQDEVFEAEIVDDDDEDVA